MGTVIRSSRAWLAVCIALAVLSWAVLPTVPSYDPFSWIVWGREVVEPHLAFFVGDGPSWKPLPFCFTVIYALFGSAAPALWVITARVGGLLGWVAAWRLATRLCPGRWGWVAGVIAVGGLLTTQDYGYYFMRGTSEPALVACTLWAFDRIFEGRRGAAFWLMVAASLIRPEWWPYTVAFAAWLAVRGGRPWQSWRGRLILLAGLLLIPVGWFGPPWLGGGHPLLAAHNASLYNGQLGADPLRAVIGRAVDIQIWPLLAVAFVFVIWVIARDVRGRTLTGRALTIGALSLFVCAWWIEVVVMTVWLGYPGLERFFLPAAAVVCVLGGVGMAAIAQTAAERVAGVRSLAVGGTLLAAMVTGAVLVGRPAVDLLIGSEGQAALAQRTLDGLSSSVAAAGGRDAVLPCPDSFAAVNHSAQPVLAWDLRTTLERVGSAMTRPGVDFIGPADIATGIPAAIDPALTRDRVVAQSATWTAVALSRGRGGGTACVGH